jgi:hypothetical protein
MDNENSNLIEETELTDAEILHQLIALRAYLIYEARGCVDGFHEEDWLQAESEILAEITQPERTAAVSA